MSELIANTGKRFRVFDKVGTYEKTTKKNGISRSFALGFVSRVERYESLVCWKRESESREKLEEERIASRRKEKRRKETKRRTERN